MIVIMIRISKSLLPLIMKINIKSLHKNRSPGMIRAVSIKTQVEIHLKKLDLVKYREILMSSPVEKQHPNGPNGSKWQCEKSLDVHFNFSIDRSTEPHLPCRSGCALLRWMGIEQRQQNTLAIALDIGVCAGSTNVARVEQVTV